MKTYAVLDKDFIVVNTLVASSLEDAESLTSFNCVLIPLGTFVDIGYVYADGSFTPFVPPVVEVPEDPGPPLIPLGQKE